MPFVSSTTISANLTGADVISRARRLFMSGRREEVNILKGSVGPNATTIALDDALGSIQRGAEIEIDTELYRVRSVDSTSNTCVVLPGMEGSTTSSHSDGALVLVNPRISTAAAFDELNSELLALSATGLYTMAYVEFPYEPNQFTYDLTNAADGKAATDLVSVYEVRGNEKIVTGYTYWTEIKNWKFDDSSDPTVFPSGYTVYLPYGLPGGWTGQTMQVLYKSGFHALTSPNDDITEIGGVPPSMADILVYGIMLRLGPVREVKRNFTESQGDTRRATEVPPQAVMNSFNWVDKQRTQRIKEEKSRLARLYPDTRP